MIIHSNAQIPLNSVEMPGAKDCQMRILIGPKDGSSNIIMRHFVVAPQGHTPKHSHNFEHVVKIEKNKGIFLDQNGQKHEVKKGQSLFVPADEEHQFQNPFNQPFEFLCIIPNPDKNQCCLK